MRILLYLEPDSCYGAFFPPEQRPLRFCAQNLGGLYILLLLCRSCFLLHRLLRNYLL